MGNAAKRSGQAEVKNKGLPRIALTVYAMSGDREEFIGVAIDGYFSK